MFFLKILSCLVIYFCSCHFVSAEPIEANTLKDKAEQEVISIISLISQQKIDLALKKAAELKKNNPNFQLGQLIYSDLLLSRSNLINHFFLFEADKNKKNDYFAELDARVGAVSSKTVIDESIPENFDFFSADIPYVLAFDYSLSRLYLFKNEASDRQTIKLKLIADQYLSSGEQGALKELDGDKKSPIGVYRITSFIEDDKLPELYGWGAFPINYPNHWDQRLSRTGSGIWLHGVPRSQYSRPPQASRGCLVVSNEFLKELSHYIGLNTPMLLSKSLTWVDKNTRKDSQLINYFKLWQNSWQKKDMNTYAKLYADDFYNGKQNLSQFLKERRKDFSKNKPLQLEINQVSIIHYPNESDLAVVNFRQNYRHGNYNKTAFKQQYWQKNHYGMWQIIDERIEKNNNG